MNAAVWFLSRITLFIIPIPALSLGLFEWYYHQATLIHAAYLGPTSPKVSACHHVGNALLRGWNPFIAQAGPLLVEAFTMKGTVLDELGNLWDKIIVRYSPVRTSPQILVCRSRPKTHVPGVACSINTLNACISVHWLPEIENVVLMAQAYVVIGGLLSLFWNSLGSQFIVLS